MSECPFRFIEHPNGTRDLQVLISDCYDIDDLPTTRSRWQTVPTLRHWQYDENGEVIEVKEAEARP